jgi:3-oxoacyl-[acyl-carrier protein] reductase
MGHDLSGKVALVTGASRGIGRAIAERLGADGAAVVVSYQHSKDAANDVVAAIERTGGTAISVQGDVSRVEDVRALYTTTRETFGGVDIVVNNAAIASAGPVEAFDEEMFDRLVAVNLKSVFFSAQQAAEHLRDGGRIVNMSTTLPAAHVGILGAYGATKGGIEVLTRALARQLGPRSITVNAVAPGPTDTDMLVPEAREQLNANLDQIPLGRIGQVDDVADVVAFLVSHQARWITGHTLPANGGIE